MVSCCHSPVLFGQLVPVLPLPWPGFYFHRCQLLSLRVVLLKAGCCLHHLPHLFPCCAPQELQCEHRRCSTGQFPSLSTTRATQTGKWKGDAQASRWGQIASFAAADLQWRVRDGAYRVKSTKTPFLQACTDHMQIKSFPVHVAACQCSAAESASAKQQKSKLLNPGLSLQTCAGRLMWAGFGLAIFRVKYWAAGS